MCSQGGGPVSYPRYHHSLYVGRWTLLNGLDSCQFHDYLSQKDVQRCSRIEPCFPGELDPHHPRWPLYRCFLESKCISQLPFSFCSSLMHPWENHCAENWSPIIKSISLPEFLTSVLCLLHLILSLMCPGSQAISALHFCLLCLTNILISTQETHCWGTGYLNISICMAYHPKISWLNHFVAQECGQGSEGWFLSSQDTCLESLNWGWRVWDGLIHQFGTSAGEA